MLSGNILNKFVVFISVSIYLESTFGCKKKYFSILLTMLPLHLDLKTLDYSTEAPRGSWFLG